MAQHFFKENLRASYGWYSPVQFGEHFYDYMDRQMVHIIKKATGLSPSPQFGIALGHRSPDEEMYQPGQISKLRFSVGIASIVGHKIYFCWKSKSGKIVSIDQEEFDENDLECWIEGLSPEKYYEDLALYTNKKPPFKIKDLPFELEIRDYSYTMDVFVTIKDQSASEEIAHILDQVIVGHNNLADLEDAKRPLQAVHNWRITVLDDERIKIYLDAASSDVLKKMAKTLAKSDQVTKVEMDLSS